MKSSSVAFIDRMMPAGRARFLFLLPVLGAAFLLSFYKITTLDVFWHVKTGQVILEQGRFLTTNTFASTFPDHPWPNPEWLFQVLLAVLYGAWDWAGLSLLKVFMVMLIGATLYGSMLMRGGRPLPAASLAVVTLCAMQFRLTERPHLFSYLFIVVVLLIVEGHRRRGGRLVWALPPLFALWSNIHPELIIGLLCLAAVLAGQWLNKALGDRGAGPSRSLAAASALCVPASILNPELHHVLAFPFLHTFISPAIEVTEYLPSAPSDAPIFWVLVLVLAVMFLLLGKRTDWSEALPVAGMAVMGGLYIRATPYLFLVACPVLCRHLSRAWPERFPLLPRRIDLAALVLAALSLTWALSYDRLLSYRWGWGVNEENFPVAAADLLATGRLPGRLYNEYGIGGYLIYRLYPSVGVFQDGRLQAYPRDFIARFNARLRYDDWPAALEDYGVNTALIPVAWLNVLFMQRHWGLVFWDADWALLVRRTAGHAALLEELEYRHFLPGVDIAAERNEASLRQMAAEMERNREARRRRGPVLENNLGIVYRRLGKEAEAEQAFLGSGAMGYALAWANLGSLYHGRGERERAEEALEKALALDPSMVDASALLDRIRGEKAGGGAGGK